MLTKIVGRKGNTENCSRPVNRLIHHNRRIKNGFSNCNYEPIERRGISRWGRVRDVSKLTGIAGVSRAIFQVRRWFIPTSFHYSIIIIIVRARSFRAVRNVGGRVDGSPARTCARQKKAYKPNDVAIEDLRVLKKQSST